MKKLISVAVLATLLAACQQSEKTETPLDLASMTDAQKESYAIAAIYSTRLAKDKEQFASLGLDDAMLQRGFSDGLNGKSVLSEDQIHQYMTAFQGRIQQEMQAAAAKEAEQIKSEGLAFQETFKQQEGVKSTDSGLLYKATVEGDGQNFPAASDVVKVHYTGSFIDGTTFDSSVERGEPATFPLNRVIPGWTEGLQLMSKGAKFEFVIPSDIAYGDRGNQRIPGGSTLKFEVELLAINPQPEEAPTHQH